MVILLSGNIETHLFVSITHFGFINQTTCRTTDALTGTSSVLTAAARRFLSRSLILPSSCGRGSKGFGSRSIGVRRPPQRGLSCTTTKVMQCIAQMEGYPRVFVIWMMPILLAMYALGKIVPVKTFLRSPQKHFCDHYHHVCIWAVACA
jgi:hypothetical protein